jgi:predicted Zn-dependent peptidase
MAFYGNLEQKVAALNSPQVVDALKKYIDPTRLVVVDAGDFSAGPSAAKDTPASERR